MTENTKGDEFMEMIAFSLGDLNAYFYGMIISLSIIIGLMITYWQLRLRREDFFPVIDILILSILLGLICARGVYVCRNWNLYQNDWWGILELTKGGFSIYGAFIGFLIVLYFYCKRKNLSILHWLDILVPAIIFGVAMDQLGHFIFQSVIGSPDSGKISGYIEYAFRPSGFEHYEYFRPVALYQAFWQFIIFALLLIGSYWQVKKKVFNDGIIFMLGISGAALGRFALGFLYLSTKPGLHLEQIFSLIVFLFCSAYLAIYLISRKAAKLS